MNSLLIYEHARTWGERNRPDFAAQVAAWRQEAPGDRTDSDLLSEYAWVVAGAGLTYAACAKQHQRLAQAAGSWAPAALLAATGPIAEVFRNQRKRTAILEMADYLVGHPGEMAALARMEPAAVHARVATWPFIGAVNRYQFLRNLGYDEVARSGPVVRLAAMLDLDTRDLCERIARQTGERLRVVDLILWEWAESTTREEQWQCCQLARMSLA